MEQKPRVMKTSRQLWSTSDVLEKQKLRPKEGLKDLVTRKSLGSLLFKCWGMKTVPGLQDRGQ